VITYSPGGKTLVVRLRAGNTAWFLDWLQSTAKKFLPDTPLRTTFLNDQFAELAANERLLGNAIAFFTALAILLAILGLIGLTMFTIERRIKEIGIRKVLGAGKLNILSLVAGNFIRLAIIASLIALPVSWWFVHHWLDNFAYRVPIGVGNFFVTEILILAIAFAVIAILTLRTLSADPVKNLRTE